MTEERVLVIASGGGIGDVLCITPVLRALEARYRHRAVLVLPQHREVIAPSLADEIWIDNMNFRQLRSAISAGGFSAAIITWASARAAYALALARVPIRVGQAQRIYSPLFTHRVRVRSEYGDRTTHWTQIQLDYVRVLGLDGDATPIPPLTPEGRNEAQAYMQREGLIPGTFGILHPTRGISASRSSWPSSTFAQLAMDLKARFGTELLISGSSSDQTIAGGIARRAKARSIAGILSLRGFTALASQARYVVAMDSGPMHVVAATGVPTVGIFAMQPDEPERWAPIGPCTAMVRPAYPCPRTHTKENCPDFACVRALNPESVLNELAGLLQSKGEAL